jgi:hypothetical protein
MVVWVLVLVLVLVVVVVVVLVGTYTDLKSEALFR